MEQVQLVKALERARHDLCFAHNLYASDREDMSEAFTLDFSDVIGAIDAVLKEFSHKGIQIFP